MTQTQTQTQALATATPQTQQVSRYNEADIQQEIRILKSAFPKLDAGPDQLRALIIAAKFSGLNPFRGEIYYIPSAGISVSSKIKAADAKTHAAKMGDTLNISYDLITAAMADAFPELANMRGRIKPGDVCMRVSILSSKARAAYYQNRQYIIAECKAFGYAGRELEAAVNERSGPCPVTVAYGMVKASEKFGGDEKFAREDRAAKRALQLGLNLGGFAAPDTRDYGGIQLQDERPNAEAEITGQFRTVDTPPAPAGNWNPEPPVAVADLPSINSPEQQERNRSAQRGNTDLKSAESFGSTPARQGPAWDIPIGTLEPQSPPRGADEIDALPLNQRRAAYVKKLLAICTELESAGYATEADDCAPKGTDNFDMLKKKIAEAQDFITAANVLEHTQNPA